MVSRHDLIKVFSRSDDSIKDEVIKGVFGHDLMIDTMAAYDVFADAASSKALKVVLSAHATVSTKPIAAAASAIV